MKNKIGDLRDHLFATLEALQDDEHPMEIDRAKAIADVARVIVDSAKAEVQFLAVIERDPSLSATGSGFLSTPDPVATTTRRLGAA